MTRKNHKVFAKLEWDAPSSAVELWSTKAYAPAAASGNVIDIYDVIGEDFWSGSGFTEKKLAGILRDVGDQDVTVNINSPGGDMFMGLAMRNRLVKHKGHVTVNVLGLAASAASIIAMGGDTVNMMTGSVMMIHKCWAMVIGNADDLKKAAEDFEVFDRSMAEVYSEKTGISVDDVMNMLTAETYMTASEAVKQGFANAEVAVDTNARAMMPDDVIAKRTLEASLAKQGYTRKQRAELLARASGKRDAAGENGERDAAVKSEVLKSLSGLIATMNED